MKDLTGRKGPIRRVAAMVLAVAGLGPVVAGEPPDSGRQEEILRLLRHDCGSCHGMRLKGGLGPPLTSGALSALPPEAIARTILDGRAGTPMPPWGRFLTERETRWLVERLLSGELDTQR